jgi:hypothetical protein
VAVALPPPLRFLLNNVAKKMPFLRGFCDVPPFFARRSHRLLLTMGLKFVRMGSLEVAQEWPTR